jgi:hypothetical protein
MDEFALDSNSTIDDDDNNDDEHYEQQNDEETNFDQHARRIVIQNRKWNESTRPESPS